MENAQNPWTILSQKEVYDNPWISIIHHDVINPSGGKGIYGKVHFKNIAIGIVPIDEDGYTWLVGQYRFPLNQYTWEIPEGGGPLGMNPLEHAQRELEEETGMIAEDWMEIQQLALSNSVSDEIGVIYLARNLRHGKAAPEETEQLTLRKIHFSELASMVAAGTITDSLTVVAVLKVQLLMLQGKI